MDRVKEGIEGRLIAAVLVGQLGAVKLLGPDVKIGLGRRRQLRAVKLRLHPGNAATAPGQALEGAGVADIIQPVLTLLEAKAGGQLRAKLDLLGELPVQKGREAGVL